MVNTFSGAPAAYMAGSGDIVFQPANCMQLSVSSYGIILPSTYTTAPEAGFLA